MSNPRTIARLQARILERAAYCLQFEIKDPRSGFITITRVELGEDLTSGKIFYSVLGGESEKSKAAHMVESAAGFIQRQVAGVLAMRRMPHLRWVYDDSMERAADLDSLIREARARDRAINPSLAANEPEGEVAPDSAASALEDGDSDDDADIEVEDDPDADDVDRDN